MEDNKDKQETDKANQNPDEKRNNAPVESSNQQSEEQKKLSGENKNKEEGQKKDEIKKPSKKKKIIIISVVFIVIVLIVYYFIAKSNSNKIEWKSTPVKRGTISTYVTATGSVNADTINIGTQVTGIISKLYADWNSNVKKDEIVALIDTTFLAAARINAQAALDKSQVQLDQAKRDYDRYKKLLDEKVASESDYETYLTNYESAKTAVTSGKAALNQALVNLQYAVIRSPANGVVISRNVELGQTVVSSFNTPTLFVIVNDLTKMQVLADVDEADIGQVKKGQPATFTVDAYPDTTFTGTVYEIRLKAVMVQNVVNYIVVINVENPELKLFPGMTANIRVKVQEHKNILKVPINALHFTPPDNYITHAPISDSTKKEWYEIIAKNNENKGKSTGVPNKEMYLWIRTGKDGKDISPKKVTVGLSDGNFTEVSGEINEGDEVITGVATAAETASNASGTKNPFTPSFPSGKR